MKILSQSLEESMCREVCVRLYKNGVGDGVESMMLKLGFVGCVEEECSRVVEKGVVEKGVVEKGVVEKGVVEKGVVEKGVVLPWCGEVIEGCCVCLKLNNGLYTQCRKRKELGEYCKVCNGSVGRNGGVAVYGTVKERLSCGIEEYKDPRGRKIVSYMSVMRKLNISKLEAEEGARKLGWEIPLCHFEESKTKRGRPKKEVLEDDKSGSCCKKRGRPRKEKELVSSSVGEDLIASLMCEQEQLKVNEVLECNSGVNIVKNVSEELDKDMDEDMDEEETKVIKVEIGGKTYLRSEENMLYDIESHDAVGMWNEESNIIEELNEEEEEEEEKEKEE